MSEHEESLRELRLLLARLCEGDLDSGSYQRIEQLVRGNPAARRLFIDSMLLHGELHWASGRSSATAPTALGAAIAESHPGEFSLVASAHESLDQGASTAQRPAAGLANQHRRATFAARSRSLPLFGAAAAAGLLVAVGILLYRSGEERSANRPSNSVAVAELRSTDGCVWADRQQGLTEGAELYAGERLELTAGVARLLFQRGATVLVESPTAFELVSATSLRLEHGTVAVRASGPVKDFVVISPDASIVDLGTSFAVHYDERSATEVEVFEGAVEVFPESDPTHGRVLEMGTNVSVGPKAKAVTLVAPRPEEYRFAALLEQLWNDIRVTDAPDDDDSTNENIVAADFSDPEAAAVDTFYDSKAGRGWLTPWVAAGNPTGEIRRGDPEFSLHNPYLHVKFTQSHERAIAREYGSRGELDPSQPHVISWRWRLEGNSKDFGGDFHDRVAFYGNPFFRRNSWPTNSWLIGVAAAHETAGGRKSSNDWLKRQHGIVPAAEGPLEEARRVFPMRWYFFDSQNEGAAGAVFDRRNMVDSGMKLKFGVTYRFAVAVYPHEGRYDAAIRDDEQTVVRTGLSFRDRSAGLANVFHIAISADKSNDDLGISLDSLRIHPLKDMDVQQQLENETADDESAVENKHTHEE
jgi:hypothetical protein